MSRPDLEQKSSLASWPRRVAAAVVDWIPIVALALLAVALVWVTRNPLCDGDPSVRDLGPQCGDSGATTVGWWCFVACWLAGLGYALWNFGLRQGRTGASVGKGLLGIRVLDAMTLQPIGFWRSVIRQLVHVVDVVTLGLGLLWPLWDRKRQTFADKLSSTVVSGTR
ncbi:hypothetical protein ASD37_26795 [Mycobacterium sp. Root135]|uniref:RDD family protein n=1 Tax=Mycobacterium sp. Root135 TaxID=1736457 RepID=UPI0006FF95BE|nr:RDD family protein [Mycobacterium sp. Root135]KQY03120.1 hypothetical protein ASD37_26795 [Mycobacterium sp. Root135]